MDAIPPALPNRFPAKLLAVTIPNLMLASLVDKLATLPVRLPANDEAVTIPRFRLALVPVKLAALPVKLPANDVAVTIPSFNPVSYTHLTLPTICSV